ncbi:MAG: hypothetical protein QM533_05130 [Cytophagales bacterium]|nr:hypothetical protein [Cytophagales bacterium]
MIPPSFYKPSIALGLGGAIAALAWCAEETLALAILWLIPLLWLCSKERAQATALLIGYYAVTLIDVATVTERFKGWSAWQCWVLYALYVGVCALLWVVCWHRCFKVRSALLGLVLLLTNLPPFGVFLPANPLVSAGAWWPATGTVGLLLAYLSWLLCAWTFQQPYAMTKKWMPVLTISTVIGFSLAWNYVVWSKQDHSNDRHLNIVAIDTHLSQYPTGKLEHYSRHDQLLNVAAKYLDSDADVVVLPEAIGGLWQANIAWLWQDMGKRYAERSKTLIVGFSQSDADGYSNSALIFGKDPQKTRARANIPIGGWQPWNKSQHQPIHLTESGLIKLTTNQSAHMTIPVFFCWEEWTLWPWLASAWQQKGTPVQAISLVNHWFAQDLMLGSMQAKSAKAYARLFGWGLHRAVNKP